MKNTNRTEIRVTETPRQQREVRNPEVIEKFYKQIINNFGYGHTTKTTGC